MLSSEHEKLLKLAGASMLSVPITVIIGLQIFPTGHILIKNDLEPSHDLYRCLDQWYL